MRRATGSAARYVQVRLRQARLARGERLILDGIDWTIRPGQRWVLAGGNGAGKTQLLKLVSGAVWPTPASAAGSRHTHRARCYLWRGETFHSPHGVQEEIGYVGPERQDKYERYGWNHTVEQVVGTGLYRTDIPLHRLEPKDVRSIGQLLRRLGIAALAQRRFLSLSYGERRLTLLARTLASHPGLLLLDELLSGLDTVHHARTMRWLAGTARSQLPWVLSTHRVEDVPAVATHALLLEQGRIIYSGPLRKRILTRWLPQRRRTGEPARPAHRQAARSRSAAPERAAVIVQLERAAVYVDGHRVLQDLSFAVRAGQCWVVHGRNGAGKTTLLRTLYGDHGVAVGGHIQRLGITAGVPLQEFKRRTGIVAPHVQAEHPQYLNVLDTVGSGRHASVGLNDRLSATDLRAARASLSFFGLAALARRSLRELSYGQLRRVLFARAWACRPRLLLLDEPFSGVDAPTRDDLVGHIAQMLMSGTAIVMSSHRRSEWPSCATHELELAHGRMSYCGVLRARISAVVE
ncbi:MAG: ATP-binding cassette domain-containing protein [Sinobacteraceae bacterium]|nr:ATP-binding cassette domain-containing protein [Nevskiaceae bacterium]